MRPDRSGEDSDWSSAPSAGCPHAVKKPCRRISLCKEGLIVGFGASERIQEDNFTLLPWGSEPVRETKRHPLPVDSPYRVTVLFQAGGASVGTCIIGRIGDKMGDCGIVDEALHLARVLEYIE